MRRHPGLFSNDAVIARDRSGVPGLRGLERDRQPRRDYVNSDGRTLVLPPARRRTVLLPGSPKDASDAIHLTARITRPALVLTRDTLKA